MRISRACAQRDAAPEPRAPVMQLDRAGKHERAESPGREPEEPDPRARSARTAGAPAMANSPMSTTANSVAIITLKTARRPRRVAADQTGQTDVYSRAYSAPESEHFTSGPYVPADLRLYDYDSYDESADDDDHEAAPRWPWVVGVAAIVAAIALVVSVSLLVTRHRHQQTGQPRHHHPVHAAGAGRDHHHQAAARRRHHRPPTAAAPDSYGDPDSDGDAAPPPPRPRQHRRPRHRRRPPRRRPHRRPRPRRRPVRGRSPIR